jgi:hypothetical protein
MKELWNRSFELFRRHLVLWVPCTIAGILMLALGWLQKAEIHWLMNFFSTKHSALGGDFPSPDLALAQHKTQTIAFPLGILKQFLEVCFFVIALATTSNLVLKIVEEQGPNIVAALRGILPRSREVLLLTVKYMAVMAAFGGVLISLSFLLTQEHFRQFALSKVFVYIYGLVGEGCLAWLLMPSAIRLLRPPDSSALSKQGRKSGVLLAVATSAASLVVQYLVGRAEVTVMVEHQWEGEAIAVINTVIVNAPQIFLFIALAVLALQGLGEETEFEARAEAPLGSRLSDWFRRAREWRGDSF